MGPQGLQDGTPPQAGAKASYRAAYERLIEVARASIKQAERVQSMLQEAPGSRRLPEELSHFAGLLEQVISQSRRRVFEGEEVPATEKLVSVLGAHGHNSEGQGT